MSEKKIGLVMDTSQQGFIIVVTPQGEFLRVPWTKNSLPEIGNEVEFVQQVARVPFFRQRYFVALVACIALFLLFIPIWSGLLPQEPQQVVAYINVDINPSLELGINSRGTVLEAAGLNEDGVKLLLNLKLIKLPVKEAIEKITAAAVLDKYISPEKDNAVLITVSSDEKLPEKARDLENDVHKVLQQHNISGKAETIEVNGDFHKQASENSISTGKYVLFMEALEEGLEVTLEDFRGNSGIKAVKEAGGIPGQLISRAKQDRNKLRQIHEKYQEKQKETEQEQLENKETEKEERAQEVKKDHEEIKGNREETKRVEQEKKKDQKKKIEQEPSQKGREIIERVKEKYEYIKNRIEERINNRKNHQNNKEPVAGEGQEKDHNKQADEDKPANGAAKKGNSRGK